MSTIDPEHFWKQDHLLEIGETAGIALGPLKVVLERRRHEWRVGWDREADVMHRAFGLERLSPGALSPEHPNLARHAPGQQHDAFLLRPRPDVPFRVLAGRDVDVYVSTPIWLAVLLGPGRPDAGQDAAGFDAGPEASRELFEIPVTRPSDTWFGASTVEGELAYLSRTAARLELDELPHRPGRAVTRIRVRNRTHESLTLERVLLPAPELQVFVDAGGHLWTQGIDVELADTGIADIRYVAGPPPHASESVPLGQPRRVATKRLLVRALSAFWS